MVISALLLDRREPFHLRFVFFEVYSPSVGAYFDYATNWPACWCVTASLPVPKCADAQWVIVTGPRLVAGGMVVCKFV
jgi:hypothetical protein